MALNLSSLLTAGEAAVKPIENIVSDVEAGIAAGGGAMAETVAVVEKLIADPSLVANLTALVNAIKAL